MDRQTERIKKDNKILEERAERYMREIRVYKVANDILVKENLRLENEILNLRKMIRYYENWENRNKI